MLTTVRGDYGHGRASGLKGFCPSHPHLSIVLVASHSQFSNRAELSLQRVNVYFAANSQLGLLAWL